VRQWIEDLSDGYLLFDPADLQQKVDGPTVVEELDASSLPAETRSAVEKLSGKWPRPRSAGERFAPGARGGRARSS
jgi:hypothetical protein